MNLSTKVPVSIAATGLTWPIVIGRHKCDRKLPVSEIKRMSVMPSTASNPPRRDTCHHKLDVASRLLNLLAEEPVPLKRINLMRKLGGIWDEKRRASTRA